MPSSQDFVIIIAQMVRGKSSGPKGFSRYKPFKYKNSYNSHPIVYANVLFDCDGPSAIAQAKIAYREMRSIFSSNRGRDIKSWGLVLHDVRYDHAVPLFMKHDSLSDDGYLYDGTNSYNNLLRKWHILG